MYRFEIHYFSANSLILKFSSKICCVLKRTFKTQLRGYVTDGLRRALEWHSRGKGFDPPHLHQRKRASERWFWRSSLFAIPWFLPWWKAVWMIYCRRILWQCEFKMRRCDNWARVKYCSQKGFL